MTIQITALILFSAVIHSIWNLQLKKSSNPIAYIIAIAIAGWIIFTPYALFKLFTSSVNLETWIFTFCSFLIHFLYFSFLGRAYSKFELSLIYPIARGLSVFLIPIYGYAILNESMTIGAVIGCIFIISGILATGSVTLQDLIVKEKRRALLRGGFVSAVVIGFIISLYSLADKNAASGIDPVLFVWVTDTSAVILGIYYFKKNKAVGKYLKEENIKLILPGVFQFGSYAIVIYAYASTMLSYAGTFREIGTVFGAVLAKIFLKENFGLRKTAGIITIVVGALLISVF